ncbi:MAG: hypothetical protein A4E31_00847 [Methanomassiliicoccales archaeon PtaU1.Bin030]|nr:MAG: hypothetical protein A4E31_00847 [Methanomassiliicoccales archaeon PtaU1.Bin030]
MGLEGKQVRVTIEPLPVAPETCHEEVIALVNSGMNEPAAPIPSCETCIHNMPDGDTLEDMGYKMQYCGHCTELPDRVSEWKPKPAPGPGASDSNDPEQERFKQKVKQFEEDCKRPRPDIAKAIQDEFKKRFREGST